MWLGISQYPHKGGGHYSLRCVSDSGLLLVHLGRSHPAVAKPLSSVRPQRIDDLQASEVSFVFGDNHAIVRFSDRGNDHVEGATGPPLRRAVGHQACPDEAGLFVEREDSAGE